MKLFSLAKYLIIVRTIAYIISTRASNYWRVNKITSLEDNGRRTLWPFLHVYRNSFGSHHNKVVWKNIIDDEAYRALRTSRTKVKLTMAPEEINRRVNARAIDKHAKLNYPAKISKAKGFNTHQWNRQNPFHFSVLGF